tara:strand:+ start:420 stop:698 length:279 start_codon:yes stop_codon:yes gene_type:complete
MESEQERIVKISSRTIYHKYCEIHIEIPKDIPLKETAEWLWDNEDKWTDELEQANGEAVLDFGFGLGDGMDEQDNEHEVRYDVDGEKYGGHL